MATILIGHASISETGGINGAKGDSTGKEVCTRTWYSKPWDYMAIHPDAIVREKHAKAVEDACKNDNIGYGQSNRNTAHTEAKKVNYVISKIKTKCNTDCSALQNLAAVISGASGVTYGNNGWTTSTMKSALQKAGYKIITNRTYLKSADYCVRGAIYVKSGSHTVCGLTNGSKASQTLSVAGIATSNITPNTTASTTKDLIKIGQQHAVNFTGVKITIDGIVGSDTNKMKKRVLQHAINLDYKKNLIEDGIFGTASKSALGTHYVKNGEKQYMVTAAEILMYLHGIDPNGLELPGIYGNGLVNAVKTKFGGNGQKISTSNFLTLIQ